jgi:uncharacterized protein YyaL (SSP411 family)
MHMHTNRLADEQSPYLLQHAHNPVDWYPWGEEAFTKARTEDKPIFLSIGYSTCHWCHVMERESFESESIAEVLNRHYISIKLDREERPDIDRIYMTFVQATTGSGGWPMSVFLTPDRKPFFGGTYFPPENRYGRPGFRTILEHLANAWNNERDKILESGDDVVRQLSQIASSRTPGATLSASLAESCFMAFRRSFDARLGGFGQAPKFPRPVQFDFLLRYYKHTGNDEALEMALSTLVEMHRGGMYDQMGGGFHRYSVDAQWFVPHFEKMLYDQGQLVVSLVEAWQITHDAIFEEIARDTLEYVLREMTDAGGGFYSAEDADSVDPLNPAHKGEGAFYIWPAAEIEELLGRPQAQWFAYRYGVEPAGNVHEDPHHEFTGRNILHQAHSIEETAKQFDVSEAEVVATLAQARAKLLARRDATRVRPHLDDKILTGWNGLMISAFAKAGEAFGEPRYRDAAVRATGFLLSRMYNRETGILLRRYRAGDAAIEGFLDDHAFFAQALLDVYEATFDTSLLMDALAITERMIASFEDPTGGFFSTREGNADVLLRLKDDYDGAEPSGNSVAVMNLLRLAQITGQSHLETAAKRTLEAFAGRLNGAPVATPLLVAAYLRSLAKPKQIIFAGALDDGNLTALKAERARRFLPFAVTLRADEQLAAWQPAIAAMTPLADGKATAYVCENFACQLPTTDVAEFGKLLE